MITANPFKGEVVVDFGGNPHLFSLTYDDIIKLEASLDISLFTLAKQFAEGRATVQMLAQTLALAGKFDDIHKTGQIILQDGIGTHLETCLKLLEYAISGVPAQKEVMPA